jgi:hypothetical protein
MANTSSADRIPRILGFIAAMSIVTALFLRPRPLPSGVARFETAGPFVGPLAGRTYALDVLTFGSRQMRITTAPISMPSHGTIVISGWALDWRTMKPGTSVLAAIDDDTPQPVSDFALARPDVAAKLHDPQAALSGFQARFSLDRFAYGEHHLSFSIVDAAGHTDVLPERVSIMIRREFTR